MWTNCSKGETMRFDQIEEARQLADRYEQLDKFRRILCEDGDAVVTINSASSRAVSAIEIDTKSAVTLIVTIQDALIKQLRGMGVQPPVEALPA